MNQKKGRTQGAVWTEPIDEGHVALCVRAWARIGVRVYAAEGFTIAPRPVTRASRQEAVDNLQASLDKDAARRYLRDMGDGWRLPHVGWWRDGEFRPFSPFS